MRTERRVGKNWVWFTLAVLFFAVLILNTASQLSLAQEGGAEAAEAAPDNFFIWIIKVSGLIGLVILCLSIYFVATVGRMFVELRPQTAMPPEVLAQCEAMLEQRDFKGIFNVVKEDDSFFSRVLVTGITELPNGLSEAREAMERVGDMLTTEMEKKISMMAVLGTLGPMIGLLGTLKGMIAAFSIIARQNTQIKSGEVAGAISESLVLTFEGVGLSVPSIWFFSFFRNRVMFISVTTMTRADEFLRHFAQAARGKPAAAAPARAKT
ncbi:MAG: MotA/TolQ/ExbB proton channel family protein [Thermoguttaceae bacterium]|jgi:biopolymer transport protein ExbB